MSEKVFHKDMTVGDAMSKHERAKEVFAGFHLGGCSHCGIAEFETIGQVCEGYGVPTDVLLDTLESLVENEPEKKEEEKGE